MKWMVGNPVIAEIIQIQVSLRNIFFNSVLICVTLLLGRR